MSIEAASMRKMALELKSASREGALERKLPWYTTAAGGLLGSTAGGALADKVLPQKLRLLGQLGGALAGTAAGLEGGEALGKSLDRKHVEKTAAEERDGPAKILGKSLLGMGLGMGAGVLIPKGIDAISSATWGHPIMPKTVASIAPFAAGALGLAAPLLQYATLQKMREAHVRNQEAKHEQQDR